MAKTFLNLAGLTTFLNQLKTIYATGYECPKLIFWNVNARNDRIPMQDNGRVTFVSGYSQTTFDMIMTGKTGIDLVKEKLDSPRYSVIK